MRVPSILSLEPAAIGVGNVRHVACAKSDESLRRSKEYILYQRLLIRTCKFFEETVSGLSGANYRAPPSYRWGSLT